MSNDNQISPEEYLAQNPVGSGDAEMQGGGDTGVSKGYIPPPRLKVKGTGIRGGIMYDRQVAVPEYKVSTPGVVTSDNQVIPFYNLSTKPAELLASMDEPSRKKFVKTLYSRGWYGNKNAGGGLSDNDIEATRNLLFYSNLQGTSWDVTFNTIAKAPIQQTGSGRVVQVSSTADLTEIANRAALQTIGRKLNEGEAARFAKAYQSAQRSESDAMAAPSADVFFRQSIEKKYGAETQATKYLSAISTVAKILGGM